MQQCVSLLVLLLVLQLFYDSLDFVQDNPGEPVPEETFTYLHLSQSSIVTSLIPPSFMIHGILLVQFICLTVFLHNLCPSFLWSTSWSGILHFILHTFLHSYVRACVCVFLHLFYSLCCLNQYFKPLPHSLVLTSVLSDALILLTE